VRAYRIEPTEVDPQRLLREDAQWTEPWGGSEDGSRCDKCRGSGRTGFECWSCLLTGRTSSCPACRGKMRWEAACPVCRGTGEVDGKPRRGVSVFPTIEGLYRYLLATEASPVGMLVELDADPADEVDFDADQGAILVIPNTIERTRPIEPDALETIRALTERRAGK
jgi:hypothetical protein